MNPARAICLVALVTALVVGAAPAAASTIAYQCGESICAIDPDATGAAPQTVVANGRLAGLTRDGATVSWVPEAGGLVRAPLAGGPPQQVYGGAVLTQPAMSPAGGRYLWSYPGPDGWGGLNATWTNRLTVGQPEVEGVSSCSYCTTTHGWLGETAIAAFPSETRAGEPSMVCRLASSREEPAVSASCVQVLARDARGGIGFPNGNPAGTEIVAALTVGEGTGVRGRIVRYSVATGAPLADVTEGTQDTTPVFSAEGDRVAFDRAGQIVVKDLASGVERVVAAGTYPFWGGERTVQGPAVSSTALRYRGGRVRVRVRCGAPTACRGTLRIRRGKRTLARRAYRVAGGRSTTVAVRLTRAGRRAIARARSLRVDVLLTPSHGARVEQTLTLRR